MAARIGLDENDNRSPIITEISTSFDLDQRKLILMANIDIMRSKFKINFELNKTVDFWPKEEE